MATAMQHRPDLRPLTYDDLLTTPEDGQRYEIIGGELFVAASPNIKHQRGSRNLLIDMERFVQAHHLGEVFSAPTDVKLTEHNIVVPDIVFVSRERAQIIREQYIEGAPDLIVEIISPSTQGRDRVRKAATYAACGVREYWLVDPGPETVLVQRLKNGRYELIPAPSGVARSEVLPGFEIEVNRIFAMPS